MPDDPECICSGNWRAIVAKIEPAINTWFEDGNGDVYRFFGLVHGLDDYYYGMYSKTRGLRLLTCVSDLHGHGFTACERNPASAIPAKEE